MPGGHATGNHAEIGRSILWYPAVGLLIGLAAWGVTRLLPSAPREVQAAAAVVTWTLITGGLHLDGLADSADALIGGHDDRERTLRIMKDPVCGPIGVSAVVLILLLKYATPTGLASGNAMWQMVWAPVLGRGSLIALFAATPYVRAGGSAAVLVDNMPRGAALLVLTVVTGLPVTAAGAAPLILAVGGFLMLRMLMQRTIGGTTGDTAGALVEVTEALVLIGLVI